MSEKAYQVYEDALNEQHSRNQARRILMRVDHARQSPHSARIRWPFELLQNALDAGPRDGRSFVTVRLSRDPEKIVFEHDGAPFTSQELAALLSGGSSKEYESDTTTGRFGTGFLVTHVLAERTHLRGLLKLATGCECFNLTLDRGGAEDTILDNIRDSQEAIRAAVPVSDPTEVPSAVLEYAYGEGDSWAHGLKELKRSLPYLYGTRRKLGRVELRNGAGDIETWEPSESEQIAIENGYMERRAVSVTGSKLPKRELCVYRFAAAVGASAVALVLVEHTPNGFKVCLPELQSPRVFREYPLRSSGFVPVNFILDGKFDPEQERSGLLMSPNDRTLLEQGLSAAVLAVRYAIRKKWKDAHWLACASPPTSGFDSTNAEEKAWWTERLAGFAQRLACIPIVECGSQFLPAVTDEGASADFIIPRLLEAPGPNETTVERLWPLVEATKELLPPRRELAPDWTTIAEGWSSLGLKIQQICVTKLAESVRNDAETLEQLEVQGDQQEWLTGFIDIVGECWGNRTGTDLSALAHMIPNQNLHLFSASALKRDKGVPELLKDICTSMEYDIREQLLLHGFEEIAHSRGLRHVTEALRIAIPTSVTEDEIVSEAVTYMSERLPEDNRCDDRTLNVQQASVRLLAHLWGSRARDAVVIARQVPLVASSGHAVRWSADRLYMGPVRAWPESAQPFADAYPPRRVLAGLYAGSETEEIPNVAAALSEWGIALTDPITDVTVTELKERRLAALSGADLTGIVVPGERFSQIALLQPEVLNRCQEGIDQARSLLGLVLCDVAQRDPAWKEQRTVKGKRSNEEVEVSMRGALWLADLKVRAWVPHPGEDDKPQKMVANAATLKDLLNPAWLKDNDDGIRLLSECFAFDQLELRLMGISQDERERQELRNSLAGLVETGGANPELYNALATEIEASRQRKRNVERCRNMGLAVQGAIGAALERQMLRVKLVDRGFDYEVDFPSDDVIEDAGSVFEVGPYLVEVKATTTGRARMTPAQAATASQARERYVLCVVDLRQVSNADLERKWTADHVEPLTKLVSDIGGRVGETYEWVEVATTLDVGIRNESALRYEVPPEIWESGMSITTWVKAIRSALS